jgi:hypothetical protein
MRINIVRDEIMAAPAAKNGTAANMKYGVVPRTQFDIGVPNARALKNEIVISAKKSQELLNSGASKLFACAESIPE